MTSFIQTILGPRIPWCEAARPRYLLPPVLLFLAAGMLVGSYFLPYWTMTLHAPQYPKGLHVVAYLDHLEGDVREIDNLNHYIGMRPLEEAAKLERSTSWISITVIALLALSGLLIHNRWAGIAAIPAVLFPVGFLLDLYFWLNHFGQNLDPAAPLSTSVKPFTPPVLGEGFVGQFKTVAGAGNGLCLAAGASLVVIAALWFHRRAFKPLFDAQRAQTSIAKTRTGAANASEKAIAA